VDSAAASASHGVEQPRKRFPASQRKHSVHTFRRERERRSLQIVMPCIGGCVGAKTTNERDAVATRRCCQDTRASHFCELQGQTADSAGSAVNHHVLSTPYV